jgi:hypothetical protein
MPQAKDTDHTTAQRTLRELLVGSLVSAAGIRAGFPFLQFAKDVSGMESILQIDSQIALSPVAEIPAGLGSDQRDHLTLMTLDSQEVRDLQCSPDGTLILRFHGGQSLTVDGIANDVSFPEPWVVTQSNINTTEGGAKVVSLGPSGFAVWEASPGAAKD